MHPLLIQVTNGPRAVQSKYPDPLEWLQPTLWTHALAGILPTPGLLRSKAPPLFDLLLAFSLGGLVNDQIPALIKVLRLPHVFLVEPVVYEFVQFMQDAMGGTA